MAVNSKISWTDNTFNGWIGCTKVSPGCLNCYAETNDNRWGHDRWGKGKERTLMTDEYWKKPIQWNKAAAAAGKRLKVFAFSFSDWNDQEVPEAWRSRLFNLIRETPWIDWQLLTKRTVGLWEIDFPPNVWLGVTTENQQMADERIPHLLRTNARIKWLSVEPQIGPIDLGKWLNLKYWRKELFDQDNGIDWVVVGGESGHHARPFETGWAYSIRKQCADNNVAFFMKQLGNNNNYPGPRGMEPARRANDKWDDPTKWPPSLQLQEFPNPKG